MDQRLADLQDHPLLTECQPETVTGPLTWVQSLILVANTTTTLSRT